MILTESPRFEVINPRPTLGETLREFSLSEWATWVGVTAASASWGYAIARPRGIRHPSMVFAGAVGFTGALCHGAIQAQSRLMGYSPNDISDTQKPLLTVDDEDVSAYLKSYARRSPPTA